MLCEVVSWVDRCEFMSLVIGRWSFHAAAPRHLPVERLGVKLPDMRAFSRFLQLLGMAIAPLAMVAQLSERISVGKMLLFLMVSVGVFLLGYTLQRYSGT